ncbi:hypothetical protein GCM10007276_13010 [Agaricicola taiwanensis]|uniref:Uncharacterized protein n=1 Tax=Agaricicola taiwanensis TaxID=591372 RepID=A0A8J2VS48_9RHOB|nr:hypothetical protein GCM10007276_13010 [Agaricicola taiwanensis]
MAGILAAVGLSACVPPTGDFGRARPSVIHDDLMPRLGKIAASQRHEPRSDYNMTDDEKELRDRSWVIVMPNGPRPDYERALVELRRTRLLPAHWTQLDRTTYAIRLSREPHASATTRYMRLRDDIEKDRALIAGFFATARDVMEMDTIRERTLDAMAVVSPRERENAMARIAENRIVIWWTHQAFKERASRYAYALERLLIETPDRSAIVVERSLMALQRDIAAVGPYGDAGVAVEAAPVAVSK